MASWKKGVIKYYVGLLEFDNTVTFVTSIETTPHRVAYWEEGKPARVFEKKTAEQLQIGLCANGYKAMVLAVPDFIECKNVIRHAKEE